MRFFRLIVLLTLFAVWVEPLAAMNKIAYRVNIETSNNNTISVPVPRLESGQYHINAIYVKTKDIEGIDNNHFTADIINKAFEGLEVKKVNRIASQLTKRLKNTPVERLYKVEYGIGVDAYDVSQELMKNPAIEYAVPVFNRHFTDFTPNDPEIGNQWHLENTNAFKAWEITKGSPDVVIGIVDSGTDWRHPDLSDNIYHNPNEIPENGIDDDDNGYVDDYNGWDFVGNINFQEAMNNIYKPDNDPAPLSNANDHGTHVAGCAAAVTNNATGIASLGYNSSILPVKCGSDNWGGSGTRNIFKGYEAIVYAANTGADIINCSWGGPGYNPAEQEIINSVVASGVLVVVSAGNDGASVDEGNFFPAGYDNVLCVGSTQSSNRKSGFSNYGIRTDVFSPGGGIYSTLPNNRYGNMSGTSMAGPVAAGLVALVKALHPTWTPHQIMAQMRSTTVPVTGVSAEDKPYIFGRIDALKAVQANTGDFTSFKTKGMALVESDLSVSSVLNSYDEKAINLKLANYLAPVDGVRLDFIPMDKFFEIETKSMVLNGLATNDIEDISITLKLNSFNPWFDGFARVLVKFTAENYEDYQLIKVPIKIETDNQYNVLAKFQEENYAIFYDLQSPDRSTVWAVGQNRISKNGIIYNSVANQLFPVDNQPVTGVYAFDRNNAWVTTGKGLLFHTTNAGLNWETSDFSSVTSFFNGIYFFNENNGVAFGDPLSGQFGVIITSNGGKNWSKISTVAPSQNEAGLVGSHCIFGNKVWFGTTDGRVIRGSAFGKSWSASTVDDNKDVIGIAFQNSNDGLALYRSTNQSPLDVHLARSKDGGTNWAKDVMNFRETLGVLPVDIKYNAASDRIYVFCDNGEIYYTEDLGETWVPILTKQGNGYQRADIASDVEKFSIYGIDETIITRLDFIDIPEGATASLLSVDGNAYEFDSTDINSSHSKKFTFKNNGLLTVHIDSVYFDGADKDAFTFFGNPPKEIAKANVASLLVTFRPKEVRNYTAKLVIKSNNASGDIIINLTGVGKEEPKNSVEFAEFDKNIKVYPIPASNSLSIDVNYQARITNINLLDLSGKLLKSISEDVTMGKMNVDLSDQLSGVYLLQFVTDKGTFYKKIVKE